MADQATLVVLVVEALLLVHGELHLVELKLVLDVFGLLLFFHPLHGLSHLLFHPGGHLQQHGVLLLLLLLRSSLNWGTSWI